MWRIKITKTFLKELKKRKLLKEVLNMLNELDEQLKKDPERTISSLFREPIVFELNGLPIRRLRYGKYRLFYIIDSDKRIIIFFDIKPRKKAYRRR